jgi:hypothetical protein
VIKINFVPGVAKYVIITNLPNAPWSTFVVRRLLLELRKQYWIYNRSNATPFSYASHEEQKKSFFRMQATVVGCFVFCQCGTV